MNKGNTSSDLLLVSGLQVNAACASQAYVVPGLLEGQDYLFRVRAENRLGFGPFTTTTEPAHARDPICEDKLRIKVSQPQTNWNH